MYELRYGLLAEAVVLATRIIRADSAPLARQKDSLGRTIHGYPLINWMFSLLFTKHMEWREN